MSEIRVPEWFIGGPMHGKDKLVECPRELVSGEIHLVDYADIDLLDESAVPAKCTYRRTEFAIGRQTLTLWIAAGVDRLDAGDRLAEILLAPHQVTS